MKVERFIKLLKQYQQVATRYVKTARNFRGFVHMASTRIPLRKPIRTILPRNVDTSWETSRHPDLMARGTRHTLNRKWQMSPSCMM